MEYEAHIRFDEEKNKSIQTVREHCEAVAEYAGESLKTVNLYYAGFLAGLLHDIGKAQKDFSDYIEKAAEGANVRRGSVIHTFQGCRFALEFHHKKTEPLSMDALADEVIAYSVGAHHGLFDCLGNMQMMHGLRHRMIEEGTGYQETLKYLFDVIQKETDLKELMQRARNELKELLGITQRIALEGFENYKKLGKLDDGECQNRTAQDLHFYIGLTARLVLSSVIEGDRRDTAHFMDGTEYPEFEGYDGERRLFWKRQLQAMEQKLQSFSSDTPIQKARGEISDICREAATGQKGVYRLNVPTGAGKTLSSLRFALAHAQQHGMNRIIFTAPLLTIIDQNAAIIRSFLSDDDIVLEHHTNLGDEVVDHGKDGLTGKGKSRIDHADEMDRFEILAESWNAPVIITSMVQLLQTFFSGKTACIRRFQALCNSVVVIDEVQTVPGNMLSLFNLMINYLSEICGVTFILCSATQPYFEGAEHPLLSTPTEIVPYSEELWKPFRRTRLIEVPGMKLEDMPEFILREAAETKSLLVICNKKTEAEYLVRKIEESGKQCFHLSASMCMAHRKKVLQEIMDAIDLSRSGGEGVISVTTQVIEAGVDISFGKVIRFAAGMDSVVQAAGRCNRNGEEPGTASVFIIDCLGEKLGKLMDIKAGKKALQDLLITYSHNPEAFDTDLSSEKAIRYYYKSLYRDMPGGHQDFPVKSKGRTLLSMLSTNINYIDEKNKDWENFILNQAFAEAGKEFRVFDENTSDVVVPFDEGERLIYELQEERDKGYVSTVFLSDWVRRAKPYTVSLYHYQKEAIEKKSGLSELEGIQILHKEFYNNKTGIINDSSGSGSFLEV